MPSSRSQAIILLAEDEENDVLLLKRAFKKAGIPSSLQHVRDGEEAIHYVTGTQDFSDRAQYPFPDIVLLDLKMPRKTGFEVLKRIRSERELRRLIVVVLTSSREVQDINRAYDLGANSYLVKPVELDELVDLAKAVHQYWLDLSELPKVN